MKAGSVIRLLLCSIIILSSLKPAGALQYEQISSPVTKVICDIYQVLFQLALGIASLVFIAAIVQFIYARDDPGKRKQAKSIMIHAVIGLILAGITKEIIEGVGYVKGCELTL